MVLWPEVRSRFAAVATTLRISATLLSTPLSRTYFDCVIAAIICASVVFPVPGGPEKMTDGSRSASIARRRSLPGARICSCPTNSSRERGRIRLASGAFASALTSVSASAKRSSTKDVNGAGAICQPLDRGDVFPHFRIGPDMKKILVPVDFSPAMGGVLAVAGETASAFQAELHLVHVREIAAVPVFPAATIGYPGIGMPEMG